jgi:DHA1 family bicyclomycin/chloramphenicol resistance-like MFS transporter
MNRFRSDPRLLAPLLAGLAMLGPFSIDTLFPAFARLGEEFAAAPQAIQQTVSVYLAAYAVMALLHGPLSDAYGRRGVIVWSTALFALASAGCALAGDLGTLLAFRAAQGISAGAGLIVGRAIVRDRYHGAEATRLMATITLIFGLAPALAPIVGGWLLTVSGWRSILWALAAFAVLLVVLTVGALPETLPRERRHRLSLPRLAHTYAAIGSDARFVWLAFAAVGNFGALWIYIASAPAIVLGLLGLNVRQFAWLFVPTIGGMMIGARLAGRYAGHWTAAQTVARGYWLMGAAAALHLLLALILPPRLPWFVLPIALNGVGVSLAFPTLTLLMLDRFPATRGAAASVQTAISLGANALLAGALAPRVAHSALGLALCAGALSAFGYGCWRRYLRRTPVPEFEVVAGKPQETAATPELPVGR